MCCVHHCRHLCQHCCHCHHQPMTCVSMCLHFCVVVSVCVNLDLRRLLLCEHEHWHQNVNIDVSVSQLSALLFAIAHFSTIGISFAAVQLPCINHFSPSLFNFFFLLELSKTFVNARIKNQIQHVPCHEHQCNEHMLCCQQIM